MSDFDFDEIDKAVSGALGEDTPRTDDSERETAQPAQRPVGEQPVTPATSSRPAPAARRGGRFMDVVHPSSDMRSRQGAAVRPSAQPSQLERADTTNDTPRIPEPPQLYTPSVSSKEVESAPSEDTASGESWAKPLESPFLPDAKVEKRPLGGALPNDMPTYEATQASSDFLAKQPEEELLEAPEEELLLEAPDEPLLEATTMPDPIEFAAASADTEPATENHEQSHRDEPAQKADEPTGPTSITQQYKEQPAAEQQPGAIYDTESYHQPIAHPAKKRSGAWVILWIFLLVVFGAGAGVLFYLYILPML